MRRGMREGAFTGRWLLAAALFAAGLPVGAKEVRLTFSAAGSASACGTWTCDGNPCSRDDLAEGDTLVVDTGALNGGDFSFEGFATPRLAQFSTVGTGAVNVRDLSLNLRDGGEIAITRGRVIFNERAFINPADGEAEMKRVRRTGEGTLQIKVAQPGCFKLTLAAGCNLYLHDRASLGPDFSTVVADALVLEDGARLYGGYSNTADRDVSLPDTHGVTIADNASALISSVDNAGPSAWSLSVLGPVRGANAHLTLYGGTGDGQHVGLKQMSAFTGTLTLKRTVRLLSNAALAREVALVCADGAACLDLGGYAVAAASLDVSQGCGGLRGPGVLWLSCAFDDLPVVACHDGAALGAAEGGGAPAGGLDVPEGTARVVTPSSPAALVKTGGGVLYVRGDGLGAASLDVQAGTVALETLGGAAARIEVAANASVRAVAGMACYEFRFLRAVDAERPVCLSELALTRGGVPLEAALYKSVTVSDGSPGADSLIDGTGGSVWTSSARPNGASPVSVRLVLARPVAVDGYLLGTGNDATGATDPGVWEVYGERAGLALRLDRREGVALADYAIAGLGKYKCGNFAPPFALAAALPDVVGRGTSVVLAPGATFALEGDAAALGSLAGAGRLALGRGATLRVDALGDWTGCVSSPDGSATLVLGTDGHVRTEGTSEVALAADGAQSVILSGEEDGTVVRGKASGTLGFVKTGPASVWLGTVDAEATGAVAVHEGRLCVSSARAATPVETFTARYVRLKPLAYIEKSSVYNWELGEFELTDAAGGRVPWPSGSTVTAQYEGGLVNPKGLIDGNYRNRTCSKAEVCQSFDDLQHVTIDTQTGVSFCGTAVYPPYNSAETFWSDRARMVKRWQVLVSDDGVAFTALPEQGFDPALIPTEWAAFEAATPLRIGPFFSSAPVVAATARTLPETFLVASANRLETRAVALKARYFRFSPSARRGGNSLAEQDFGLAISEFDLYREGARIPWGAEATATSDAIYYAPGPETAIDNDFTTRSYSRVCPYALTIDAGRDVVFDAYGFHHDTVSTARAPVSWRLFVSDDGSTWHEADAVKDAPLAHGVMEAEGPWPVAGRWPIPARANVVGDAAPLSVAADAEFWLNTDAEQTGALSGAGRVTLFEGSLLALNPAPSSLPAFSGAIEGRGSLMVVGTGTQVMDGARWNGVTNLVLSGGTLAGTAVAGGDLAVAFAGGRLAGSLTGIGALTVTGDVVFAVPADAVENFTQPLLAWTSIDAASKERLRQAAVDNASPLKTRDIRVVVTDSACVLRHALRGSVVVLR